MIRAIVSVIAGAVAGMATIVFVEALGHVVVPVAGAPKPGDAVAMRDFLARMPVSAYGFILLAYAAGCYLGGRVAGRIAGSRASRSVWAVGALLLAVTVANFAMIPHPSWFVIAAIVIIVAATWLATRGAPAPEGT